jgi:NTE family protein
LIGQPLNTDKLDRTLTRLTGLGRYDTLGSRIEDRDGKQGLLIVVREKNYAPPSLQPAFQVDGSESGDVNFTLASRLTVLDVAGFRSEWRTDFLFGNTYGVASELYRPFSPVSRWFFAPRADASDRNFRIYGNNDPEAEYRIYQEDLGFDVGYGFSRFSEIRVGYEVGDLNAKLRLGTPEFSSVDGRVGDTRLHYLMDHTDDPVIPRSGYGMESNFRWFDASPGATSAFPKMDAQVGYYHPITYPASVFVTAAGGTTFGSTNTGIPQFFLGGPLTLSAYGNNELFGNQYYLFRTGYLHGLVSLPPLLGKKVYAIGAFEFGKVYGATTESKFPDDIAAGVLAETVLGPFFVGGSVGDSGHRKWFFQLGRVF